jgi:hypothetical protein
VEHGELLGEYRGEVRGTRVECPVLKRATNQDDGGSLAGSVERDRRSVARGHHVHAPASFV